MQSELTLISAAASEPLSLEDAKLWLHVDGPDDDNTILPLITAAREHCERFCRRSWLVGTTWKLSLDHFPQGLIDGDAYRYPDFSELFETEGLFLFGRTSQMAISLPMGPATEITEIAYVDPSGTAQVLSPDAYELLADEGASLIYPVCGTGWPATRVFPNAVQITFKAGSIAPQTLVLAMKQLIGHWYANREAVVMSSGVIPQEVLLAAEKLLRPLSNPLVY